MNLKKTLRIFPALMLLPLAGAHAQLLTGRHGNTATLLPDGNFMVTGGMTGVGNAPTPTVEIFFTSAAAWGTGESMATPRSSHTATLMSDGRVLVAGGFNAAGAPLQSAEIYNPKTGHWAAAAVSIACPGVMCSPRGGHTATLLNKGARRGQVLLCGGQSAAAATAITPTCEFFAPTGAGANTFDNSAASMNSPRIGHTASGIKNGKVFVSGGKLWNAGAWVYLPTNELYDSAANVWTPATPLNEGRAEHSATVLNNGNIMIEGGYNAFNRLSAEELPPGVPSDQNAGSHGYLGSAEMFNPEGGRVPIVGGDYGVMPYRVSRHSALLSPEGQQVTLGGYGNIVPTSYGGPSILSDTSFSTMSRTGLLTADLLPTSQMAINVTQQLSRTVDGRIVDGDLFLMPPISGDPTIEAENVVIVMVAKTTATLDGSAVGSPLAQGMFQDDVSIKLPRGTATFSPQTLVADQPAQNFVYISSIAITPIKSVDQPTAIIEPSSMTINASFPIPGIYAGSKLTGTAEMVSANILYAGKYTIALSGGSAPIVAAPVVGSKVAGGRINVRLYLTGLAGIVANVNTDTTTVLGSGINAGGRSIEIGLTMKLSYTVDRIDLSGQTYKHDPSNMIIREMIFSDELNFNPKSSKWAFNLLTMGEPLYSFTSMVTPAADFLFVGGRNCEPSPYTQCLRTRPLDLPPSAPTFTASAYFNAYVEYFAGAWATFPALSIKRAFHTSTVLPDSSILTCGGTDGAVTLQSCELLAPASSGWVAVSSMTSPRALHTATLLSNGTVLVAGGTSGSSTAALKTAELFYPATRRWVPIQSMHFARQNHTANLLPNGDVLITGGGDSGSYLDSAEIYKTTAAVWEDVPAPMSTKRTRHTAVNTKNGDILIIGGVNGTGAIASVDRYHPFSKTWNGPQPDPMATPRYDHAATLLRDGRVVVSGGSDNTGSLATSEIFDGTQHWRPGFPLGSARANHRSVLLPNGKLMVTGGERGGVADGSAEGYDPDFDWWNGQGTISPRSNHTTVLLPDNYLVNIGGWSGSNYLSTCETAYFSYAPDQNGLDPKNRNPLISQGPDLLDRGQSATLISSAANFHGLSEASGGGAGAGNASFHNPRVYIQAVDIPTGFLTDITTRLYTLYDGVNDNWETTLSSMTLAIPLNPGELPYGYYHLRVAENGQFSPAHTVQITVPRPTGSILFATPAGVVQSSTAVQWSWTQNTLSASDGYAIFSSSNDVFMATAAFAASSVYTQSGLTPNTEISVKIGGYNTGGYSSPLIQSPTYYTFAVIPSTPTVDYASFETAGISWSPLGNSPRTTYEVSMSKFATFLPAADVIVPVPFNENHTSTSAVISALLPNQDYYFRVRAKNGSGVITNYSGWATTTTVSNVTNLTGAPQTMSSINWSWDPAIGNPPFEVYDVTAGTTPEKAVFLSSTTTNSFLQTALSTNTAHMIEVNAYNGSNKGPKSYAGPVYTLSVQPLPGVPMVFTNITTNSFTVNWLANGNPAGTNYRLRISMVSGFDDSSVSAFYVANTSYTVSSLTPNTRYYAELRALNGDEIGTLPFSLGSDYTLSQAPSNFAPAGITMSGVSLIWDTGLNPEDTVYEVRGSTLVTDLSSSTPAALWSKLTTGNSVTATGLLTATTYYCDVAAYIRTSNHVGPTARTLSIPAVYTLPGPSGAPSGAMGGTSDPSRDVTISGTLPNGRTAALTVPADAFASPTAIAISSFAAVHNACNQGAIPVVEVEIYTQAAAQPQVPVTLVMSYNNTEAQAGITNNSSKLVLSRYNPVSGECLPLETKVDPGSRTITAKLNHFSTFQLVVRSIATDLSGVRIYPNPFYTNRGQGFITINNIPASTDVNIYTLSGDKIWSGTAGSAGMMTWDATNNTGVRVASGIYLVALDSTGGKKVFKVAVER